MKGPQSEEAAWDAIFLIFSFHDANRDYVSRRQRVAQGILDRHGARYPEFWVCSKGGLCFEQIAISA